MNYSTQKKANDTRQNFICGTFFRRLFYRRRQDPGKDSIVESQAVHMSFLFGGLGINRIAFCSGNRGQCIVDIHDSRVDNQSNQKFI